MGLDILVVSKAVRVPCRWENATDEEVTECDQFHTTIGEVYRKKDGIKPGCYILGKGGREFGFRAGTASGYGEWRDDLSLFALGVPPDDVWEHPRRYRGKPFVELIDFPDSMGYAIGPVAAAKLHADFATFAAKAKRHYLSPRRKDLERPPTNAAKEKRKPHRNRASQMNAESLAQAIGGSVVSGYGREEMWKVYQEFRQAFRVVSKGGFVLFC